jgi:hypothetical protein
MISASLYMLQEKLMFFPTILDQNHVYEFEHNFEELFLKAEDKAVINALHFKTENPKGVILYFHGNAGDLQRWGKITGYYVDLQYDVFVMDYRTYGKSTGPLSEQAFYDDAQMCYDHLLEYYSSKDIIIYGRSLGSGVATNLASKNNANQLILETPYFSIADVAKYRFPIIPVKKLLKYELPNYQFIKDVSCKIAIIHGTEDAIVPFKSGKKLFDIAPKDRTTFYSIEGAGHGDLIQFDDFKNAIQDILK